MIEPCRTLAPHMEDLNNYRLRWEQGGDTLYTTTASLPLNSQTKLFLKRAGLPRDAAPFLSFELDEANELALGWLRTKYPHLSTSFEKYVHLGVDGGGNPLVIDAEKEDTILWLDHEDLFKAYYINKNIKHFGFCLLVYRDFVLEVNKDLNDDQFFDEAFTDGQFNKLKSALLAMDDSVLKASGFWAEQLDVLLTNREDAIGN